MQAYVKETMLFGNKNNLVFFLGNCETEWVLIKSVFLHFLDTSWLLIEYAWNPFLFSYSNFVHSCFSLCITWCLPITRILTSSMHIALSQLQCRLPWSHHLLLHCHCGVVDSSSCRGAWTHSHRWRSCIIHGKIWPLVIENTTLKYRWSFVEFSMGGSCNFGL